MIIHLEAEWDDAILERFALVIAQQSIHFALQFNWILQGALEDYEPELTDGSPNPNYNQLYYTRCLKLLKNVERCVVYGKPRAQELQRLYEKGKITKKEMIILEQADRRFNALQIVNDDDSLDPMERLDGWVYIQLPVIDTIATSKHGSPSSPGTPSTRWDYRYCVMERNVLNVYKTKGKCGICSTELALDRALSLERCQVDSKASTDPDYTLIITTKKYSFTLKFSKKEEKNLWARRIDEEASAGNLFDLQSRELAKSKTSDNGKEVAASPPKTIARGISKPGVTESKAEVELTTSIGSAALMSSKLKSDLTPAQLNRYDFFQNERRFVQDLTDIAEDLRFEDRAERKKLAPGYMAKLNIPPNVYLPLCNSSDIWRRVSDKLADETRVFNTKERCPVVMQFISKRGESRGSNKRIDPNIDIAQYMHNHFDVVAAMEEVAEVDDEDVYGDIDVKKEQEHDLSDIEEEGATPTSKPKKKPADGIQHSEHSGVSQVWDEDDDEGPVSPKSSSSITAARQQHRGNTKVQRLLRESVVTLPKNFAKRLNPNLQRKTFSVMDRQTTMQPVVPILEGEGNRAASTAQGDSTDEGSVVSVERSSVLIHDTIVMGAQNEGDIDAESLNRAIKIVSGGESWAQKSAKMLEKARKESEEAGEPAQLEIASCLAKSNDDLRQEVFMMQMIHYYKSVFAQAQLPIWLRTYRILSTGSSTGLLELLTDATSLDALKKSEGYPTEGGLRKYFEMTYGGPDSKAFKAAQKNFMHSLVGYALVSYLLGLKDRHNGNIMIDTLGHLIFIDFGFAMGMKVAHEFSFERAPFKLTKEYVEVMDGVGSECYNEFERLFVAGFEAARKNSQIALGLVEIMMYKSNYPCFSGWRYGNGRALPGFEKRLMLRVPDHKVKAKALRLVRKSRQHIGTYAYDVFQKATNGYAI